MINNNLITVWDRLDTLSPQFIREKYEEEFVPILLELIIHKVRTQKIFEIVFFEYGKRKGSGISYPDCEDKQLELRLYQSKTFELALTLVIDGDPYFFSHKLTSDDISFLPEALINKMKLSLKNQGSVECGQLIF
jgi:hypothetical protein